MPLAAILGVAAFAACSNRYRVKHAPVSGLEPQQRTIDSYQSSTVASGSQTIDLYGSTAVTTGIDQSGNRKNGNGPYTYHGTNTGPVHSAARDPRVSARSRFDAGTAGADGDGTIPIAERGRLGFARRNTTWDFSNTGSYKESGTIAPGVTTSVTANANGTATLNNGGTSPLKELIGLPSPGPSGMYQIPVTRTSGGSTQTFLAADWYPGNAAPPSPLASTTQTVVGSTKLPSTCHAKVAAPSPQEVDTTS